MEVIEVDQLEDTNNERLSWAMPHSGLKPKLEDTINDATLRTKAQKWKWHLTEDDIRQKTAFDGRRSLRWTSSKRKIMEVIEVDQLEDTNNEKLSWAMPHSGLKPKLEDTNNERLSWAMPHSGLKPKNENYIWQKATFDGRRPLTEDDLWQKTTFDRRWA